MLQQEVHDVFLTDPTAVDPQQRIRGQHELVISRVFIV